MGVEFTTGNRSLSAGAGRFVTLDRGIAIDAVAGANIEHLLVIL